MSIWDQHIAAAMSTGAFESDAKRAAARWDVCAIAERLSPMERQWVALLPLRPDAGCQRWHDLGLAFNRAVQADDPRAAKRLLDQMRREPGPDDQPAADVRAGA